MKLSTEVNSWLVILVILITSGITSWVMLGNKSKNGDISPYYSPQQLAQNLSPGIMAMNQAGLLVAATRTTSVITAGAVPLHADLGPCTNCHTIVTNNKDQVPIITAAAISPHKNRRVCVNCHRMVKRIRAAMNVNGMQFPANTAQPPIFQAAATPIQKAVPRTATWGQPATKAAEGEWMGMEVAPITPLTASQFGIPGGTRGLVITEVEAQAFTAGLKAGDVLLSVNGVSIFNMVDFVNGTQNGMLTQGIVEILRRGQKMALNITQRVNPAAGMPNVPINAHAGIPAARPF